MHTTGSRTRNGTRPLVVRTLLVGIVAAIAFGLLAMYVNSARAGGAFVTFTVNNSGDAVDANPGDGNCNINPGPPSVCTMRAAIMEANALNGPNIIKFTATNTQLTVANGALPTVTERVIIDASDRPDGFTIDASLLVGGANGLTLGLGSSGSVIRGLIIKGAVAVGATGNGLVINGGAAHIIGGDPAVGAAPAGQGNIFEANGANGILITTGSLGAHTIRGNRIGTTPLGTTADGNTLNGISINGGIGAAGPITIGSSGACAHCSNLISSTHTGICAFPNCNGISFSGGTAPVVIQDNWIGLDVNGNAADPFANGNGGVGDGVFVSNAAAAATIVNNHLAGGGVNPSDNPGGNGIRLNSVNNTVLGNCIGFNSTCTGSTGGFRVNGVRIVEGVPGGSTVGDGTAAGRNVIGNTGSVGVIIGCVCAAGVSIAGGIVTSDDVLNGNFIGFGADGQSPAPSLNHCVGVFGGTDQITNNVIGNCGGGAGIFNGIDVSFGDGNLIKGNDLGRGTTPGIAPIDGFCIRLNSNGNQVLTNTMANCGGFQPGLSAIRIASGSFNVITGNNISSPIAEDAVDILGGGLGNLVASQTFRMVNPGTSSLPIDLVGVEGVNVNFPQPHACPGSTNCLHNYPVFAPASATPGCAGGSAGPYDQVRVYSKSTSGGVTTYERLGEGQANIAGDFQICLNNTADVTVVGTATTTVASTTDTGCGFNCTSEFSVTQQLVLAGATPTPTATATPTITNTPPPANTPTRTPVPPPATNTPVPPPPTPAGLCGDVNGDGVVNPVDSQLILQLSAGSIASVPRPANADVNHDGVINPVDATLILQKSAGYAVNLVCA